MAFAVIQGSSKGLGRAIVQNILSNHKDIRVIATTSRDASEARESILSGVKASDAAARLTTVRLDVLDEQSISGASRLIKEQYGENMGLLVNVSGILHAERSLAEVNVEESLRSFQVNTIGHLLVYKHFVSLLPPRKTRNQTSSSEPTFSFPLSHTPTLVSFTARVGSIGDNKSGGWYSYRASKSATNQIIRTLSHELRIKHSAVAFAYHPGTVKTGLSEPYVGNKAPDKSKGLFTSEDAASNFLKVLRQDQENGSFVDWKGERVQW